MQGWELRCVVPLTREYQSMAWTSGDCLPCAFKALDGCALLRYVVDGVTYMDMRLQLECKAPVGGTAAAMPKTQFGPHGWK